MQLAPPASPPRSTPEPPSEAQHPRAPATRRTFGLSGAQVAGSALAAATSALAASSLGVAGTVFGALIGSLVLNTASAVYSHSLRRVGRQIRLTRPTATPVTTTDQHHRASGGDHMGDGRPTHEVRPRRLSWGRVTVAVAVGAVLALGGITVTEKLIGHPISHPASSGTSIGAVVRGDLPPAPAPDEPDPKAPGDSDSDGHAPKQAPGDPDDKPAPSEPAPSVPAPSESAPAVPAPAVPAPADQGNPAPAQPPAPGGGVGAPAQP